jgi:predicted Rossmann fold nucleotide-binding protein DprA/Smf involved in DNA uptake
MALKTLTAEQRDALKALRESMGGISEEKRKAQKQLLAARKEIARLLAEQPATVPQIAETLGMPAHEVLWHLTGMRKYGKVADDGEDGDYLLYALVSEDAQPAVGH